MPRATKDARLDTAAARARLPARKKPHYRLIDAGLHLGYYRGAKASGTWIARRYTGAGNYETQRLGVADDGREADGADVLTFSQAQAKARAWTTQQVRQAAGIEEAKPWTVTDAVQHYLADYAARGGKARRYVETTFDAHVTPKLGPRNPCRSDASHNPDVAPRVGDGARAVADESDRREAQDAPAGGR